MKKRIDPKRISTFIMIAVLICMFCGCSGVTVTTETVPETVSEPVRGQEEEEDSVPSEAEEDDGLGDTFSGVLEEEKQPEEPPVEEKKEVKDVDLILFMGQSNMSGAGGDASLAPSVSEDAGMEFRAISDPTRLYPITEPFGINENDPEGLSEYPGAKKGSLVSAFVNRYHELTGRKVVAVSISMGATDMNKWMTDGAMADVRNRFERAVNYLNENGYTIGHKYAIWLHGESDAIGGTDPAVYRTDLDNIMRPLFIGGLQRVFIITPGRTIDLRDVFLPIINVQKQICAESGYYALATTVLTKVSTEYMLDMYHYNQHVLNLVGIEAADSVAYFTNNHEEKIVYDYREGEYIVPDGVDPDSQKKEEPLRLSEIDINSSY